MAETAQATEEKQEQQTDSVNNQDKTQVQSVELSQAQEGGEQPGSTSFDILLDMKIPVTVTIGQTNISIKRLLQLGQGSVIVLDKNVGAPVELYLKGSQFATGDIVVVDDKFAVRIKQVLHANPLKENETESKE